MDDESLYKAFITWEQKCRGWLLWNYAVELEPPFSRITPEVFTRPLVDDAKVQGGITGLLTRNRLGLNETVRLRGSGAEIAADVPKPFYRQTPVTELQLVLPRELGVSPAISEQFLLSLGNHKESVGFEIFADSEKIEIQLVCGNDFSTYLKSHWKALYPAASLTEREGFLASQFTASQPTVIVDFALANNFVLPLRLFRSFDLDPLSGLLSALSNLNQTEKAVFQILFQPLKGQWVDELRKTQLGYYQKLLQVRNPNFNNALKSKLSSPLFAVSIRLMFQAPQTERAWEIVRQIGGTFRYYTDPNGNELIALSNNNYPENDHKLSVLSRTNYRSGMLLNTSELASLVHSPSSSVSLEKLHRSHSVTKAAPAIALGHRLILGENTHDGKTSSVTLSNEQRARQMHIIGSTGSGKSTLLLRAIIQDIEAGVVGLCVIDPHGDLIDAVCERVPESRLKDVVLFDPSDSQYPIGLNILQAHSNLEKTLIASDLVAAFKRMSTSWGDVMDAVLANAVLAILESERGGTLIDLKRFLVEASFRNEFLQSVNDEFIRYFWQHEFPLIAGKPQASILIRLDTFLRQKMIRNIVCQKTSKLNFREIMDHKKILLIKLSQGIVGVENSHLLGSIIITKLHQIALSRQDTTNRPFFAIYIDEFHNLIVPSLEASLSGNRKFNIGLTLSHQEWRQVQSRSLEVAASVMANCYTRICFRLGDTDAKLFANGFSKFEASALQNLGIGEAVARIERADYDFNLKTIMPPPVDRETSLRRKNQIIEFSRSTYAVKVSTENERSDIAPIPIIERQAPSNSLSPVISTEDKEPHTELAIQTIPESKQNFGRAGQHHKELQAVIKRMGESYGFRADMELSLDGGGRVDVSLEKDNLKIACEVSVTTTDYEGTNVLKCLAAGFDHVVTVVSNQKKLPLITSKIRSEIPFEHRNKVKTLGLTGLLAFLRELGHPNEPSRKTNDKPAGKRLNFTEACEFFGVTSSTLYRWVKEGRVPFYRPGREYQFDRDELVLIGKHDLSGKRKASVKLTPLTIDQKSPKGKKNQNQRYRNLLKLD